MRKRRKMDPRLVSKQKWELAYIASKFRVSVKAVQKAIKSVGHSRIRVYAELRA